MINGYPTKEELRNRIMNQLSWRGRTDTVGLLWHGYLSSLLEWGLIEFEVYDELCDLLPTVGTKEKNELFADEPLSAEEERAMEDHLMQKKQT